MPVPIPTVLYVEDDADDVVFLRRAFQAQDVQCNLQTVSNLPAAKSYLTGKVPYDDRARFPMPALLVTDMTLPDSAESSIDLASWIRSTPELAALPILCASDYNHPRILERFASLGISCYPKNGRMKEIADAVKLALRGSGSV